MTTLPRRAVAQFTRRTTRLAVLIVGLLAIQSASCTNTEMVQDQTDLPTRPVVASPLSATSTRANEKASATPLLSLSTEVVVPTPFASPSHNKLDYKVAYATFERRADGEIGAKIWVISGPGKDPMEVWRGALVDDSLAWSRGGTRLVFAAMSQEAPNSEISVTIIDLADSRTEPLFTFSVQSQGFQAGPRLIEPNCWSAKDQWIYLPMAYVLPDGNPTNRHVIVGIEDHQVTMLDAGASFGAWSLTEPDHFLYVDRKAGRPNIHIGVVGLGQPLTSILAPDDYELDLDPIAWSVDGSSVALSAYDPASADNLILSLDLRSASWEVLTKGKQYWPLAWSSDQKWLVLASDQLYLRRPDMTDAPQVIIARHGTTAIPAGWTPDNQLVVQDGPMLYLINPIDPDSRTLLLDLHNTQSLWPIQITLWLKP